MKRITIKSNLAHFKVPLTSKKMTCYPVPPPSTVLGMLKVIYGREDINNFSFGYTIEHKGKHTDVMTLHKVGKNITDCVMVEYLINPTLTIYTDITEDEKIKYCLTMGRSNCLAKIIDIAEVELQDIEGTIKNQWLAPTVKGLTGKIQTVTTNTLYRKDLNRHENDVLPLRLITEGTYQKNHDAEREQNIYMFKFNDRLEVI